MYGRWGRVVLAGLCGAVAVVVIVGCGGSDDESLTKAEFVEQADAICVAANKEKNEALEAAFAREAEKGGGPGGEDAEERLISDVAMPPIEQMTTELSDLGTPSQQGELAERFIEALEDGVAEVEANPRVAITQEPFEEAKKLAADYGFKSCVEF